MTVLEEFYKRFDKQPEYSYQFKDMDDFCTVSQEYNTKWFRKLDILDYVQEGDWLDCYGNKRFYLLKIKKGYIPITLQVERDIEELILNATDELRVFKTIYSDKSIKYHLYLHIPSKSVYSSGTTRQEALLSLCIKLADELGEEFVESVKEIVK